MERNRKDRNGGVLDTVAELFDLPADLVAGLPHLEMMGSHFRRRAAGPGRPPGPDGHDGGGAADRRGHCRRGVGEVTPC